MKASPSESQNKGSEERGVGGGLLSLWNKKETIVQVQIDCNNSGEALGQFPYRSTEGNQEVVDLEEVGEESLEVHIYNEILFSH